MKTYRVTIETSVEVKADSAEAAAAIAEGWAREDLSNSNAYGQVFEDEASRDDGEACYTWEP